MSHRSTSSPRVSLVSSDPSPRGTDRSVSTARVFGGMRFPDKREPPPGPLSRLSAELAPPPHRFSASVDRMIEALPPHVRTDVLKRENPRVLDRLASVWRDPRSLRQLLDELMFEGGRQRQSLSFDAMVELTELKDYFMRSMYSERISVWDEALGLA